MQNFQTALTKLNPQQRKAVETTEGPVMVVAGPGTGKTQMLALRIAYILKNTDASAENVLCLTFTESGVRAMRQRLMQFVGNDAYKVSIHTFHSFANEIIQTFPDKFNTLADGESFAKDLKQLDDVNRIKLLQQILEETEGLKKITPFHNKFSKIPLITSAIQNLKKEGITPDELKAKVEKLIVEHKENPANNKYGKPTIAWTDKLEKLLVLEEFCIVYKEYQSKLATEKLYDYEDMIMFVNQKFGDDDSLLAHYQERFLYILVDEYQDTNGAQNSLLKLLGSFDSRPNIFVVGDDDQAIYRFQGANLGNILFFNKNFEDVVIIPTEENYRSTQIILDVADTLISANVTRLTNQIPNLSKKITAAAAVGREEVEIHEFNSAEEENLFVANNVKNLIEQGVSPAEIAIIYRKNSHAEDISLALQKEGIEISKDSSRALFEVESTDYIISILVSIWLFNKTSTQHLYQIMLLPFFQLNVVDVYKCGKYIYSKKIELFQLLTEVTKLVVEPESESSEDIRNFVETLSKPQDIADFTQRLTNWHRLSQTARLSDFVQQIMHQSGLIDFYTNQGIDADFNNVLALTSFFNYVKQSEKIQPQITLKDFLNNIEIIKENNISMHLPKIQPNTQKVQLMTAHSSKGLEFSHVFLIKATDNNWGKTRAMPNLLVPEIYTEDTLGLSEKELTLEDERRLFYVALTRAKQKIYITLAKEYITEYGSTNANASQFINELGQKHIIKHQAADAKPVTTNQLLNNLKPIEKDKTSAEEEDYLRELISKFKLSASTLNKYLESPAKFKVESLLKMPQPKSKDLAMGTAVHSALEYLNKNFDTQTETFPALSKLIETFNKSLHKEFAGDEEFERTMEEGQKILTEYYNHYILGGDYTPACEVEYNFYNHNIYLNSEGQDPIALAGRLDKCEPLDSASLTQKQNMDVRVVDYKTSQQKSVNEILGKTKNSNGALWRQLVFYKLLADLDNQFRPNRSVNYPKYNLVEAEIDFVRNKKGKFVKRRFQITNEDVEHLKTLIEEVMRKIRNLEFPEKTDIVLQ